MTTPIPTITISDSELKWEPISEENNTWLKDEKDVPFTVIVYPRAPEGQAGIFPILGYAWPNIAFNPLIQCVDCLPRKIVITENSSLKEEIVEFPDSMKEYFDKEENETKGTVILKLNSLSYSLVIRRMNCQFYLILTDKDNSSKTEENKKRKLEEKKEEEVDQEETPY